MSNIEEDKLEKILHNWDNSKSIIAAKSVFINFVQIIGPGFHPDTQFSDYVSLDDELHTIFSPQMASRLQKLLDEAAEILEMNYIDPCEIALPVQRQAMGLW